MNGKSNEDNQENAVYVVAPITQREIDGTTYVVYGYFSPEARETATEKIRRLITKEARQKHKDSG